MTKRKQVPARRGRPGTPAPRRSGGWRILKWLGVAAIWGAVALVGIGAYFAYGLPGIEDALGDRRPRITLLAVDGSAIAAYGDLYADNLSVAEMAPMLPRAVIAIEDRRFYSHFGVDPIGIVRAALVNAFAGRIVQGGSTITQQLAKNLFLTPERTLARKIREVLLAFWLEHKFSKDQILAIYLNRVYLGAGAYGVDAAARRYFGKSARTLSLAEAAMIAGLLKAPSRYAPNNDLASARARAAEVVAAMRVQGAISDAAANDARQRPARPVARTHQTGMALYFADWVAAELPSFVGASAADLIVVTTLDPALQRAAEAAVVAGLEREGARLGASEAALVAMDADGAVRALVGGRRYAHSQFNRATQALRQPGSAFKLFVYAAALETGVDPEMRILDAPLDVNGYRPRNHDGRYRGEVSVREAFAQSINTAAVRLGLKVGLARVAATARRMGIAAHLREDASLALGSSEVTLLELVGAYATVARAGYGLWPHGIVEIRDRAGRVLYRRSGSGPGRVLSAGTSAALAALLHETVTRGTGRAALADAALPGPIGGKTGTSQDFRDAWFVGYAGGLVAGVWLGNDDGRPMRDVAGGGPPAHIWRRFMTAAHGG